MTAPGGGGFSFGTPQTQASPFGATFGQPVQTSATGMQSAFGAAAPTGGVQPFSFGATPTATVAPTGMAQPFSFGTPATQTGIAQPFSFGTSVPQASTAPTGVVQPFSFGGAATAAPAAPVGVAQPFSFGMTATRPQTGGFSFGASQPTTTQVVAPTQTAFGGFGATTAPTASTVPSFGGFGAAPTPAASTVPAFGGFGSTPAVSSTAAPTGFGGFGTAAPAAPSGFVGFGAPATTPASTAPTGFGGFGVPATTTTSAAPTGFAGFGAATSAAATTPAATPFGGFGLGSGVTITPVASSAPSTFTGFGTTAPASTFGAAPASGFGALATPATTTATSFVGGFGVPTTTAATSVAGFGMPVATSATGLATTLGTGTVVPFGSTPTASTEFSGSGAALQTTTAAATVAQSAPSLPVAFGSATTTATVTTATPTATTTVAATTAVSLFGSLGTTLATTTAATSVPSFAGLGATTAPSLATVASTAATTAPTTTTTAATTSVTSLFGSTPFGTGASGFPGFGQTTTTTSSGLSQGSLSATSALGFSTTTSATTSATSTTTGLGGVDILPSSSLPGSATTGKADKAVKEACLPNEILQTVDAFKKYVTEQKEIREEISRVSSRTIAKVQEETAALRQLLSAVESGVQRNGASVERLKRETSEDLKHAEIAHRTKETPVALQYENTAPTLYFQKLVASFGQQMKLYKQQIEELEQHFASLSSTSVLTPEELIATVNKLYQTFTFLAAQLYSLHEAVQKRKEEWLSLRSSGPGGFSLELREKQNGPSSGNVSMTWGPTPFSSQRSDAALAMASALARAGQPSAMGTGILGSLGGQPGLGSSGGLGTSSLFGGQPTPGSSSIFASASPFKSLGGDSFGSSATGQTFQLQRPPPGNKRGKR